MKAVLLSPPSVNPKTHIHGEEREKSYYPRCRKDANCNCEMCIASINATLDLMPMSAQRSTLTKRSVSKPSLESTPVSIDPTLLSTPSPVDGAFRSTLKSGSPREVGDKRRKPRFRRKCWWVVVVLGMILAFEFGFWWAVYWVLRPVLSGNIIEDVFAKCSSVEGLSEKLNLVQRSLEGIVGDGVSSCNLDDSTWKIDQDGMLMHSYCIMYQSAAEEIVIRGWPLQTAGLLTAAFSSRSFSVLSGKLIEWPEGNMVHVIRAENSTWTLRKWSASVVKFDANTWIIEYKKNMFLEDPNMLLGVIKFLNFRITKFFVRMRHHVWLLPDLSNFAAYTSEEGSRLPT
ncbi:hypothetical protein RND81_05G149800 [Saponaria officinalis]|uniref:C-8 sterol isomerase n=1 Tax=Saponaria officinalis TaxID=3572 RepID=A0AAW1KSI8_SAPOF